MPNNTIVRTKIPVSVKRQVQAVCADFHRREVEIERSRFRKSVLDNYKRLNKIILATAREVCQGESDALITQMIKSLGEIRGYNWTPLVTCISRASFYERKRQIVEKLAERLKLM